MSNESFNFEITIRFSKKFYLSLVSCFLNIKIELRIWWNFQHPICINKTVLSAIHSITNTALLNDFIIIFIWTDIMLLTKETKHKLQFFSNCHHLFFVPQINTYTPNLDFLRFKWFVDQTSICQKKILCLRIFFPKSDTCIS